MKTTTIVLCSVFALLAFTFKLHTETFRIDPTQSSVEWFAEKLSGKHNGTIMLKGGELKNNHGSFTGFAEIDMNTIVDKDLENETYKNKLENHLKSPDFFDVTKFPTSKFVVKTITALAGIKSGGFTHHVTGDLTIKDKTNPIAFDANIVSMPDKLTCTGSVVVDRSKFDVKYGSKTFFEDIGDKMIYDEFTLKFNIVAVK